MCVALPYTYYVWCIHPRAVQRPPPRTYAGLKPQTQTTQSTHNHKTKIKRGRNPPCPAHNHIPNTILTMKFTLALATLGWNTSMLITAFSSVESRLGAPRQSSSPTSDVVSLSAEGFGSTTKDRPTKSKGANIHENSHVEHMSTEEIKQRLIDLIPRMTGKDEEYRAVEAYVNLLEEKYAPVQTIDFLNLAMAGDWQLVSSFRQRCLTVLLILSINSKIRPSYEHLNNSAAIFNQLNWRTKQKIASTGTSPKNRSRWIPRFFNKYCSMGPCRRWGDI